MFKSKIDPFNRRSSALKVKIRSQLEITGYGTTGMQGKIDTCIGFQRAFANGIITIQIGFQLTQSKCWRCIGYVRIITIALVATICFIAAMNQCVVIF